MLVRSASWWSRRNNTGTPINPNSENQQRKNSFDTQKKQDEERKASDRLERVLKRDADERRWKTVRLCFVGEKGSGKSSIIGRMGLGSVKVKNAFTLHVVHGLRERIVNLGKQEEFKWFLDLEPLDVTGTVARKVYENIGEDLNGEYYGIGYGCTHFERIDCDDYIPTHLDLLVFTKTTNSLVEHNFNIDGISFEAVEVGGKFQKTSSWMPICELTTAIVFVVDLSCYKNRPYMYHSAKSFLEISLNQYPNHPIILLFNKVDIFEKQIVDEPVQKYYSEITEHQKPLCFLMKELFLSKIGNRQKVYAHPVSAYSADVIQKILHSIKQSAIQSILSSSG